MRGAAAAHKTVQLPHKQEPQRQQEMVEQLQNPHNKNLLCASSALLWLQGTCLGATPPLLCHPRAVDCLTPGTINPSAFGALRGLGSTSSRQAWRASQLAS